MGITLESGESGKFAFSQIDHAVTDADITDDYDVVIPRDGVYSVSAEGPVSSLSTPTLGSVSVVIQIAGVTVALWLATPRAVPISKTFNLSRVGVDALDGDEVTVFCSNTTDVDITFGFGVRSHLDVTYEGEASLLP